MTIEWQRKVHRVYYYAAALNTSERTQQSATVDVTMRCTPVNEQNSSVLEHFHFNRHSRYFTRDRFHSKRTNYPTILWRDVRINKKKTHTRYSSFNRIQKRCSFFFVKRRCDLFVMIARRIFYLSIQVGKYELCVRRASRCLVENSS